MTHKPTGERRGQRESSLAVALTKEARQRAERSPGKKIQRICFHNKSMRSRFWINDLQPPLIPCMARRGPRPWFWLSALAFHIYQTSPSAINTHQTSCTWTDPRVLLSWKHRSYLVDDVDAVVDLLPSEDGVEIVEPVLQVVFSVTEWNDDGDLWREEAGLVYSFQFQENRKWIYTHSLIHPSGHHGTCCRSFSCCVPPWLWTALAQYIWTLPTF